MIGGEVVIRQDLKDGDGAGGPIGEVESSGIPKSIVLEDFDKFLSLMMEMVIYN